MDSSKLSNSELRKLLIEYHEKAVNDAASFTQNDLHEAWNLAMESLLRSKKVSDEQNEQIQQLQDDLEGLIVTDITYRAAYKFIHEKGMQIEFERFLNQGMMEVLSNVVPFPNNH